MNELKASIKHIKGFKAAGVRAGIKKNGKPDFTLIVSDAPCMAAGVFTKNLVKAAPVLVDMQKLSTHGNSIRAVAINSGGANACTGQQGIDNALETARYIAGKIGCHEDEVLLMSTGVIGVQLPMDKIRQGVDLAVEALDEANWYDAACAIMTTDTRPKSASINTGQYTIGGIAKGAGMIAPNMATMLSVVLTDAAGDNLTEQLQQAAENSFNRIVVDGDMSTNDTVLFLCNGTSGVDLDFAHLNAVCEKLAKDVVYDGEGATKFVTLHVAGTQTEADAKQIANTLATSPLVKTAFYGNDANWGRILAAAGRAGVNFDPNNTHLWIGDSTGRELKLLECGTPLPYAEAEATDIFKQSEINVRLDCGSGSGSSWVWTTDLSHDYVSINADYRS